MNLMCILQESVNLRGVQALNLTLDFNEKAVLEENIAYLQGTLEVRF